jgi:hypothetical protein
MPRSRTSYQHELRSNREERFKALLANRISVEGIDISSIEQSFLTDVKNLQNRTRGRVFEVMGTVGVRSFLQSPPEADLTPPVEQKIFHSPLGERRVDLYYQELKTIVEIKSGYVVNRASIRLQVSKDGLLLDSHPEVVRVVWLLYRGGSKPLIRNLEQAGIEWHDLEFDLRYSGASLTEEEIYASVMKAWPREASASVETSEAEASDEPYVERPGNPEPTADGNRILRGSRR